MPSQIKLINLTPINLQKTDNILNTLLFMCLDQGHDFHDGSARTKTNDGKSTWVDLDLNGKGYLNKINQDIFDLEYAPNQGVNEISADKIFGKKDFIKGLLNTTFVGGDGAYGLVIVEDVEFKKYNNESELITKIEEIIKKNIIVNLIVKDKYYITTTNDCAGEHGMNFIIDDQNTNILFLPFYQRVYNGDMHKLWTFNSKKHIYIIKLTKLELLKSETNIIIQNPTFKCEKFTTIDLIVPQYYFNFKIFFNFKKKISYFFTKLNEIMGLNLTIDKEDIMLETLIKLDESTREKAFEIFSECLFTGKFIHDIDKPNEESFTAVGNYDDFDYIKDPVSKTDIFVLKYDVNMLDNIPRGVKYYFKDCQYKVFKYFLDLLYKYQTPFIHNQYKINDDVNSKIEETKQIISNKLLDNNNSLLMKYVKHKIHGIKVNDDDVDFLSKQYGFITDTNIGNNAKDSTADSLINSLNNTTHDTNCSSEEMSGGAGELNFLNDKIDSTILKIIERGTNYRAIKYDIKNVYLSLCNSDKELTIRFADFIKQHYGVDIVEEMSCQKIKLEDNKTHISNKLIRRDSDVTTAETITPASIQNEISKSEYLPSTQLVEFNNIDNVNNVFNLKLNKEELTANKLTKIGLNSSSISPSQYLNNYSNSLQLYYDRVEQTISDTNEPNYFNNCWQSTDFYQQEGGSNYPFKFIVASGSLDSSSLGGQSIPQYHPPEVDIYMPIFEITGSGQLKGVIVRMVFVKEVLNNPTNSKSQVVVFCHFVYVDFERTKITPPTDSSQYATKIGELLQYVINNTYYKQSENKCVDINVLKQGEIDINSEENVDFTLKLYDDSGSLNRFRNWYKYFTFTQGPTVKESIVIPTNFYSLDSMKSKAASDYVAIGIINVAENIIQNSSKLREIFNDEDLVLYFIKLFLIRNKYTGDKSRSTDTLFLNETKYLEGVQISNDENTLYNSQMFGLNTIWSTSSKSVFYMTPYYTPNGKMTVINGSNVEKLCKGLLDNPKNKGSINNKSISSESNENERFAFIEEFKERIIATLNSKYISIYNNTNPKFNYLNPINTGTLLDTWSEGMVLFNDLYSSLDNFKDYYSTIDTQLNTIKLNQDGNEISNIDNIIIRDIIPKYRALIDICSSINKAYKDTYSILINFILQNVKADLNLNNLTNMFILLSKTFPWWTNIVIENYIKEINNILCNVFYKILQTINELLKTTTEQKQQIKIYKNILSNYKLLTTLCKCNCLNIINNSDEKQKIYRPFVIQQNPKFEVVKILSEIDPQEIQSLNKEEQTTKISMNDKKFEKVSLDFLTKIKKAIDNKENLDNIITDLSEEYRLATSDLTPEEVDNINSRMASTLFIYPQTRRVTTAETGEIQEQEQVFANLGGAVESQSSIELLNKINFTNPMSEYQNKTQSTVIVPEGDIKINSQQKMNLINQEYLTKFYNNSYKCNNGNYLKSFITIIREIESIYTDLSFTSTDDIKTIMIKILLIYIDYLNTSFSPKINNKIIIDRINSVDKSYTAEQMNCVINLYLDQLDIYSTIYSIINNEDYTPIDLINILDENISDFDFNQLSIPFTKKQLKDKIKNDTLQIVELNYSNQLENSINGGRASRKKNKNKKYLKTRKNDKNNKKKSIKRNKFIKRKYTKKI